MIGARQTADAGATPAAITDGRLQEAYDYWLQKCRGRHLPCRADIDPTEIPKLLPDVLLTEILPNGRYRYRLIGTEIAELQGVNATGRFLDEILPGPEYKAHILALYDECVHSRRALYTERLFLSRGQLERHIKTLFLPLSEDGETVNMIFVVQAFLYVTNAIRARHFIDSLPFKEIAHALL